MRAGLLLLAGLPFADSYAGSSAPPGARMTDRTRLGTLDVPRAAIGTINWVPDDGGPSDARLLATFAEASRVGLNFFDTAERYGASPLSMVGQAARALGLPAGDRPLGGSGEALLGSFARDAPPSVFATKFTPVPWRASADAVVDAARASAARLGSPSLDLYQAHMPDVIQPMRWAGRARAKDEVYWEGLAQCYHAGLVRNVGVSNYGPTLLARCHAYLAERRVPLCSNQICFSLLSRSHGAQRTVDWCAAHGVAVLAYYPLAMGLLTGRWSAQRLPADRGLHRYLLRDGRVDALAPLVAALEAIGAARGCTPAQVALNWVISRGALPVVGVTSPEHVRSLAGALGWRLGDEERTILEAAAGSCGVEFEGSTFRPTNAKFVGYGFEKWELD